MLTLTRRVAAKRLQVSLRREIWTTDWIPTLPDFVNRTSFLRRLRSVRIYEPWPKHIALTKRRSWYATSSPDHLSLLQGINSV